MRILFVAFSESIHTARWIQQLQGQDWELHLFPSVDQGVAHGDLRGVTVHYSFYGKHPQWPYSVNVNKKGLNVGHFFPAAGLRLIAKKLFPQYRVRQLARVIQRVQPDLIHSLEIQHGGYLVNEVRRGWQGKFPKWMVTNWGSDIYLFGKLKEHQEKIRNLLEHCDYYSCECQRDVDLARTFGFKGTILPVFPNTGGIDLDKAKKLRSSGKTSERKIIALKGYQNWAGRALVGLRALERCKDVLAGYEIVLYSVIPENSGVVLAAELFSAKTGIPIQILPLGTSHEEILRLHGKSRLSIGLSIGDGASTSFLEALAMGSFPIQSNTACADEWIECGETGFLVPPEDSEKIEQKIRIALADDELVDQAALENWKTAQRKLDAKMLQKKTLDVYAKIMRDKRNHDIPS